MGDSCVSCSDMCDTIAPQSKTVVQLAQEVLAGDTEIFLVPNSIVSQRGYLMFTGCTTSENITHTHTGNCTCQNTTTTVINKVHDPELFEIIKWCDTEILPDGRVRLYNLIRGLAWYGCDDETSYANLIKAHSVNDEAKAGSIETHYYWTYLKECLDGSGGPIVSILESVYPIGSIYTSVIATNPSIVFGFGTWTAFGSGKILVGLDPADGDFNTVEGTGGSKTHTLTTAELPVHTHTQGLHTHVQNQHTHVQDAHTHTQTAHTHTQDAHTHTQTAHTHTQNAHTHGVNDPSHSHVIYRDPNALIDLSGVYTAQATSGVVNTNTAPSYTGISIVNETATNQNTTATNQNTTSTNQNTTATNQNETAINNYAIATNQNAIGTNSNTGSGDAHDIMNPYIVVYFFKRVA